MAGAISATDLRRPGGGRVRCRRRHGQKVQCPRLRLPGHPPGSPQMGDAGVAAGFVVGDGTDKRSSALASACPAIHPVRRKWATPGWRPGSLSATARTKGPVPSPPPARPSTRFAANGRRRGGGRVRCRRRHGQKVQCPRLRLPGHPPGSPQMGDAGVAAGFVVGDGTDKRSSALASACPAIHPVRRKWATPGWRPGSLSATARTKSPEPPPGMKLRSLKELSRVVRTFVRDGR